MTPARILLGTTNRGKIAEITAILAGLRIELLTLDSLAPIPEPAEHGTTFAENARQKALYYAAAAGMPALADDSGLEIDALDKAPGIGSARFDGATYPEKFERLYRMLRERSARPPWTARFVCEVALAESDRILFAARGTVEGVIADAPRGSGGFGYDPIFFHPSLGATLAEVPAAVKAEVSHRGQAFRALRRFLEEEARALAGAE